MVIPDELKPKLVDIIPDYVAEQLEQIEAMNKQFDAFFGTENVKK